MSGLWQFYLHKQSYAILQMSGGNIVIHQVVLMSCLVKKSILLKKNLSPFTKDFCGEEHYNESID